MSKKKIRSENWGHKQEYDVGDFIVPEAWQKELMERCGRYEAIKVLHR